jgi:sortase (surface protein transpeptidase)
MFTLVSYPGTGRRLVFHELDKLLPGDEIFTEDRQGRTYRYLISETFMVQEEESWVMDQLRNRDMVTL